MFLKFQLKSPELSLFKDVTIRLGRAGVKGKSFLFLTASLRLRTENTGCEGFDKYVQLGPGPNKKQKMFFVGSTQIRCLRLGMKCSSKSKNWILRFD